MHHFWTYWYPCITFGRVAEIADQGHAYKLVNSCGAIGVLYFLLGFMTGFTFCNSCRLAAITK
ncbi:hypothetical protein Pint_22360 [Pistacia integerrima]|uniref:Uncharacterized protein n=1 Tax=Pistacia integerrima TaxID=434235 RepID=A0ACC0YJ01_9ROSI|nr:hypothetical protein Pint_22360 [Pistacia integerrima]